MGRSGIARGSVVLPGILLLLLSGFIGPAGVVHGAGYGGTRSISG